MAIVYILTNECMPGLVKIGHTDKSLKERLKELETGQLDELNHFIKAGIPLRMEYVLLLSESEESLRVTHGNYFGDDDLTLDEYLEIKREREREQAGVAV